MSNSSLVSYTKISPFKTSPRNHVIDTVTIHCYVGQTSVESAGNWFSSPSCGASCNYVIGYDGRIGLIVDEGDRSYCSSNRDNDHRAITIEVASGTKHPYTVNDAAYKSLINLLVDICERHPAIGTLKWKGEKSLIGQPSKQNMTVHRWFASKECPGEYLYSRHAKIAAEVNTRLGTATEPTPEVTKPSETITSTTTTFKEGDLVSVKDNAKYYNGSNIPDWVTDKKWYVKSVDGDRVVINKSEDGKFAINSPVNAQYLTIVTPKSDLPYMVKVDIDDLNIRKGPGTGYGKNGFTGKGIFTITEIKDGAGSKSGWGKLKSGVGWISLDYAKRV